MKRIVRNFIIVIERFTSSSVLNITGLAVAFAVFYIVIARVYYDFGFDGYFEKRDHIYMYSRATNTGTPVEHAAKYPEIKNVCFTNPNMWMIEPVDVKDESDNTREFKEKIIHVSEGFIDMFIPGKIIRGDARRIFEVENHAMLTVSIAKKFFGDEDPLGKIIFCRWNGMVLTVTVSAVCEDFPDNCRFDNGIYFKQPQEPDANIGQTVFVEIAPGTKDRLTQKLNSGQEANPYELIALRDVHFRVFAYPLYNNKEGSIRTTLSLLAIGILILVIAYINFVNFSVAMSPVRLKGFNIRRIMGEHPLFQKFSIAMEAVLISFVAFSISLLIVRYFNVSVIGEFLKMDLSLSKNTHPLLLTAGASLVAGFIAGIYPAFYATHFKPAMALTGSFSVSFGGRALRNLLIGFQFIAAVCLIIVALFIKTQHSYLRHKSTGIKNIENIVCLPSPGGWRMYEPFKAELTKSPDIIDVTSTTSLPGDHIMNYWERQFEGKDVGYSMWGVSPGIIKILGIEMIRGRAFEEEDFPGKDIVIVNRTFVDKYGFDMDDMVGKNFPGGWGNAEIVGIMEDFNFKSLKNEQVSPIAFFVGEAYLTSFGCDMLVKINGKNRREAIGHINETWKQFSDEVPNVRFLDEKMGSLYEDENSLAKLISICGLITVIVTIMGAYGLILFNVKLKRKTIALRKINGASVREVILLLNRGFIIQFVIAYAIAAPLAYTVVRRWLENFAYKTPIHWWVFIASGLLVFLITALTVSYQSYRAATANPIEEIKTE